MIDKNNSMVAAAMNYAIPLGLFWVFKYIFVILGDYSDKSLYVVSFLSIFTPVIYYVLLYRYKDINREGRLDYGDAILFSMLLFLFASFFELVIICLHIFIINPAVMADYIQQIKDTTSMFDIGTEEQRKLYNNIMNFYMVNIKVIFIISRIFGNFLLGLFLSLILGYFVSRQNPNQSTKI